MEKVNTATVGLNIYGFDYETDDLSILSSIANGEFSKKGEVKLIGPKDRPAKILSSRNMWTIKSDLSPESEVEAHIDRILTIIAPYEQSIKSIAAKPEVGIMLRCTLYYKDFSPGIQLSKEQLSAIANLGAVLDLDLYFLGDDDSE